MGRGDKPRGRMSTYAFFVQTSREEHKKKHPEERLGFAEFSRHCAERWRAMSEKEKQRFHQMAEKDKKRYESEMADYNPTKGETGRKRKLTKDPNAPKRPLSAFFWFSNDERPKVKESMPEATVGEIAKVLGAQWHGVSSEVRSKYEALAAKDKARYEKEVEASKSKKLKATVPPKGKKKNESDEESGEEEEKEDDEEIEEAEEDEEEEDDDE